MKISKDERGVFHPMAIGLVLLVLAVIGFAGYKVMNKNGITLKDASGATAANSAAETSCNNEINDKTFCKFVSHFSVNNAYRATITSTDDKGAVSKMELENDTQSNTSMVTKDSTGKETGAFITLGNDSYVKDEASGSWTKYTSAAADTSKPTSDIKINTSDITSKNTISYKNLGTEACGKLTCYKYQVVDSANTGTTQYIWFDNKNYLMQRWSSKDANGSSDMSFSYQSINIKAPTPIKEASASADNNAAEINAAIQAAEAAATAQ